MSIWFNRIVYCSPNLASSPREDDTCSLLVSSTLLHYLWLWCVRRFVIVTAIWIGSFKNLSVIMQLPMSSMPVTLGICFALLWASRSAFSVTHWVGWHLHSPTVLSGSDQGAAAVGEDIAVEKLGCFVILFYMASSFINFRKLVAVLAWDRGSAFTRNILITKWLHGGTMLGTTNPIYLLWGTTQWWQNDSILGSDVQLQTQLGCYWKLIYKEQGA